MLNLFHIDVVRRTCDFISGDYVEHGGVGLNNKGNKYMYSCVPSVYRHLFEENVARSLRYFDSLGMTVQQTLFLLSCRGRAVPFDIRSTACTVYMLAV